MGLKSVAPILLLKHDGCTIRSACMKCCIDTGSLASPWTTSTSTREKTRDFCCQNGSSVTVPATVAWPAAPLLYWARSDPPRRSHRSLQRQRSDPLQRRAASLDTHASEYCASAAARGRRRSPAGHARAIKHQNSCSFRYRYRDLSISARSISSHHLWAWSTKAVISNTGIFVAIDNNTLYGSKLSIFLLCQKSLGY